MTDHTALALLRDAESYLSALHGSVARHDNLAANLGCAGCELRDRIAAALPTLAAAPAAGPATPTDTDQAEAPCQAAQLHIGHTPHTMGDTRLPVHCPGYTPAADEVPQPPADPTGLRQRIAETLTAKAYECDGKCGLSERECYDAHPITFSAMCNGTTHIDAPVTAIADAVLAVLPAPADRAAVLAWAADFAEEVAEKLRAHHEFERSTGALDVMTELRRLADETATTQTPGPVLTDAERTMLTYALDQAQEHIWSEDGFTDEDQAAVDSLRRLTDVAAVQPAGGEQ